MNRILKSDVQTQKACVGSVCRMARRFSLLAVVAFFFALNARCTESYPGPGSLLFVVEREAGNVAVVNYRTGELVKRINIGGNMRHASMVFDQALEYGYIAARDGKLHRIRMKDLSHAGTVDCAENAIGLAISSDSRVVAVAGYKPGGITLIDTESFTVLQQIPTLREGEKESRVTGLVDAPDNAFLGALMDRSQIWKLVRDPEGLKYTVESFPAASSAPFDALITPDARYYITGHFNSREITALDLRNGKTKNILLSDTLSSGTAQQNRPVKMPHMEAWAVSEDTIYLPASDENELKMLDRSTLRYKGRIALSGSPVYAMVHPGGRYLWVSFAGESEDGHIEIVDLETAKVVQSIDAGKRIYHMGFTPRGDMAFISSNLTNELIVMDAKSYRILHRVPVESPSGIFGVWRAFQTGL